jgi:hypothetical protein
MACSCLYTKEEMTMHIQFTAEGGIAYFPGLNKPVSIDTAQLPPQEAAELERLVQAANFFDLPPAIAPPSGAADYLQYTISIESGDRQHNVQVSNFVEDPTLLALVSRLKAKAKEFRASSRAPKAV